MQSPPAQKGIPQPGLIDLDLATTGVQDSRLKDWACDPLTNQLAQRLAEKSRYIQELRNEMRSTIELHNNRAEEQASTILKLSAEFRNLTQKIESAEKVLCEKNTEIQRQKEAIKNLAVITEDQQAENTKLAAKLEAIKEAVERDLEDVSTSTDVPGGGQSGLQGETFTGRQLTGLVQHIVAVLSDPPRALPTLQTAWDAALMTLVEDSVRELEERYVQEMRQGIQQAGGMPLEEDPNSSVPSMMSLHQAVFEGLLDTLKGRLHSFCEAVEMTQAVVDLTARVIGQGKFHLQAILIPDNLQSLT
uniref:Uncharacterized protein n=1 Tax=Branchiostoma floridae TaxID=7739 RepID=C3Y8Q9_BRAFL|eukprot:XP_002606955.1 hypothetical protein BRAFLDRAFT_64951 [Branchiostoma floridae]